MKWNNIELNEDKKVILSGKSDFGKSFIKENGTKL